MPKPPPNNAKSRLSVSHCRTSRRRVAPKGKAHRDLSASRRVSGEKKIGQVCASDQQNDDGDPEKNEECVGQLVLQLPQTLAAREQLHVTRPRDPLVVVADSRRQLLDFALVNLAIEEIEAGLGLDRGDLRLEAGKNLHPLMTRILQAIRREGAKNRRHHHRDTDIRDFREIRSVKSWRRNADHRHGTAVENELVADDRGIAAETTLPIFVTQDRHRMSPGNLIIGLGEESACEWLHP